MPAFPADPMSGLLAATAQALGTVPAGLIALVALIVLFFLGRIIAEAAVPLISVMFGLAGGVLVGRGLALSLHWHPALAAIAGLAALAAIELLLGWSIVIRVITALALGFVALGAMWQGCVGALDQTWAIALTGAAAFAIAGPLLRWIGHDGIPPHAMVQGWIEDLRGG